MSDSIEEQYKNLNLSLDDLSITSEIKPINSEESVNLLDKFNEISDKNKFEINDFEKKDINNKVEKELNNSAKIVSNDINEVKNNDPEINKLNDSDKKEVPNIMNDSAILDQIFTLLDEKDFAKANDLLVEAQNKGINNGRIYLAKIMLDMNASNLDQLGDSINFYNYSQNSIYFNEALNLCDKEIQICLKIYVYRSYCKNHYYNAKILLNEAKEYGDISKIQEVSRMFEEIIDYKDSKECHELCKKYLEEWDKKEVKYNNILDGRDIWKSASLNELLTIEKEIKDLDKYKESKDLINEIQSYIDKKQNKLKRYQIDIKLKKVFLVFLILVIIICILICSFVNTDFVKNDPTLPLICFFCFVGTIITILDLIRCHIFKPKI
jgi:hypothetical protein